MQGNVGVLLGVDDTWTGFGERNVDRPLRVDHLGAGRTYADEDLAVGIMQPAALAPTTGSASPTERP